MTARILDLVDDFVAEWRAIPWTPRARRLGRSVEGIVVVFALIGGFGALAEGIANWLLP